MTIRRFNYTGRKRIPAERFEITLSTRPDGTLEYTAGFVLNDLELPSNGRVIVEAIHQHAFQRFDHGRVAELVEPSDRTLHRFVNGGDIQFVAKVVEEHSEAGEPGLIRAESAALRPEDAETSAGNRVSILRVASAALREVPWKLDLGERPVLLVNDKVGDWRSFSRSKAFSWLVYPAVCREVFRFLILVENERTVDDLLSWRSQWIKFGMILAKAPVPPKSEGDEAALQWIEDVVDAFCTKLHLWQDYGRHFLTEADS